MREDFLPSNPGPVPVTRQVRRTTDTPTASHRSAAFETDYEHARDGPDHASERSGTSSAGDRISQFHSLNGDGR